MRLGRVIELRKHTSLELYRRGKPDKKLEPYLNDRGNLPGSWLKCRIRSGSLQTRDFSGRILNRPISERLCPFGCPQRDNPQHILFECNTSDNARQGMCHTILDSLTEGHSIMQWLGTATRDDVMLFFLFDHDNVYFEQPPPYLEPAAAVEMDRIFRNFITVCWKRRVRAIGNISIDRHGSIVHVPFKPSKYFRI